MLSAIGLMGSNVAVFKRINHRNSESKLKRRSSSLPGCLHIDLVTRASPEPANLSPVSSSVLMKEPEPNQHTPNSTPQSENNAVLHSANCAPLPVEIWTEIVSYVMILTDPEGHRVWRTFRSVSRLLLTATEDAFFTGHLKPLLLDLHLGVSPANRQAWTFGDQAPGEVFCTLAFSHLSPCGRRAHFTEAATMVDHPDSYSAAPRAAERPSADELMRIEWLPAGNHRLNVRKFQDNFYDWRMYARTLSVVIGWGGRLSVDPYWTAVQSCHPVLWMANVTFAVGLVVDREAREVSFDWRQLLGLFFAHIGSGSASN